MAEQVLDTALLLREFRDRQRERGRFDFQRVAVDSAMATGLVLVSWVAVKAGLGLHEVTKAISDPVGAAEDAARAVVLSEQRLRLKQLKQRRAEVRQGQRTGLAREGSLAARFLGAKTLEGEIERLDAEVRGAEADLLLMEREDAQAAEVDSPGIPMLKNANNMLDRWVPVAPAAIVGTHILLEVLRVKRERGVQG